MAGLLVPGLVYAPVRPEGVEASATLERREPAPLPKPRLMGFELDAQPGVRERLEASELDGGSPGRADQIFPEQYSTVDGVFTFRGGPTRTGGAFGLIPANPKKLEVVWSHATEHGEAPWFGGAGWTGQPVIVRWPAVIRHSMPRLGRYRADEGLVEVIQGSLDGHVYFLDLYSGAKTRQPLDTGNPIKGSVSLDPRAFPLLFVGQGIPGKASIGLRAYELIHDRQVFFLPGHDERAPRRWWGAFDSSGLLNRKTDTYVVGGENGLVYTIALHTDFDPIDLTLSVKPEISRYRYANARHDAERLGVESSLSVVQNLAFFADNSGLIQAVDLRTWDPLWVFDAGDDTDASVTVDWPALYTACEVDRHGVKGQAHLRKLDARTGSLLWTKSYACEGTLEPVKHQAGVFATNVVGRGDVADLVFFTLSRCPGGKQGAVVALDKETGKEVWRFELPLFSWSSPTLLTDVTGKSWLLQGGIGGVVRLLDARSGKQAAQAQLVGDIEASPAVFDDRIVLGTRADRIYGLRVRGDARMAAAGQR
ncbi:MAG: PQQ-binding-like beta-propeller repeat protein [Archangiaceae bacterium]|nr:PQQ-binding-like beta-propeller repeat protein [Archangiaceae bacterium]